MVSSRYRKEHSNNHRGTVKTREGGVDKHRLKFCSACKHRLLKGLFRPNPKEYLGGGELGDGLGALRDGMLGQLTGENQANGSLDLTRGQGALLVDASKAAGLGCR